MPWHLADIWWKLPEKTIKEDFHNLEIDVIIEGKFHDDLKFYIAPIGLGYLSDQKFYAGMQTHMLAQTKDNERRKNIGRGGIFSMWGERDHKAIRPGEGGFMESAGHEGDFISIRRQLDWSEGKYTCRLQTLDKVKVGLTPYTWVGYFVYDHQKDEQIFCGALRFEGHKLRLKENVAGFIEIFGFEKPKEDTFPQNVTITLSAPRVNDQPAGKPSCSAIFPEGIPDIVKAKSTTMTTSKATKSRAVVFTFTENEFKRNNRSEELYRADR